MYHNCGIAIENKKNKAKTPFECVCPCGPAKKLIVVFPDVSLTFRHFL